MSGVFLERFEQNLVFASVDNVDRFVTELNELVDVTNRHWLVGLNDNNFIIKNVFKGYFLSKFFLIIGFDDLLQIKLLNVV